MGKFRHALPRLHFGGAAPAMLTQQDQDQPGLYQNNRTDDAICSGIPLPCRYLAELDSSLPGEAIPTDAPTRLPPVEDYLLLETSPAAPASPCRSGAAEPSAVSAPCLVAL